MTTYDDRDPILGASPPPPEPGSSGTAGAAASEGKRVASTAADEGQRVAQVATGEAKQVAGEAKQQAANLLDEARVQLDEQSRTQRDRLVGTLRTVTGDLEKMASGEGSGDGMTADWVRQAADRARQFADRIDGREPAELLEEVRSFARRRPGTFLVGALVAGVVAGRITRGARDASSGDQGSGYDTGRTVGLTGPSVTATAPVVSATPPVVPTASVDELAPSGARGDLTTDVSYPTPEPVGSRDLGEPLEGTAVADPLADPLRRTGDGPSGRSPR